MSAFAEPSPVMFSFALPYRLTAQLARTEEAAKRAMIARDASARGGAAQRLLDVECELSRVQADCTELEAKYMRERKRAGDFKTRSEELKRRLDTVLRDQRQLVQRLGNAEARRSGAVSIDMCVGLVYKLCNNAEPIQALHNVCLRCAHMQFTGSSPLCTVCLCSHGASQGLFAACVYAGHTPVQYNRL